MRTLFLRWQKGFALIALFILSFSFASFVGAQENTPPLQNNNSQLPAGFIPPSLYAPVTSINNKQVVDCFDYYKFNSVQVNMETNITGTVSGTPIMFSGKIENQNSYPIVDGAVYAKVFKKQSNESMIQQNGNDLVDQFFVKENLSLPANSKTPFQFEWKIPTYAVSGDYQIAFFFTSARKFNLLGLSFTDDVVGNTVNFSVAGEQKIIPFFNKNTVKLNNSLYHFAAFPPQHGTAENIVAGAQLVNPTDETRVVQVTWKLYVWDAQNEGNLLDVKKEDVALNPKETRIMSYTDEKPTGVVHLLIAEAKYKDTKSLLDIRYTRTGIEAIRLNFPSITSYPLLQNKEATLFSCLHNTGADTVPGGKLTLTLKDQDGKSLHTYTYNGAVSSAMMAVKDTYIPKETLKTFSLEATLWQDGREVDTATMRYECEALGGKDCPKKATTIMGVDIKTLVIDVVLFILFLIVLSLSVIKRQRQKEEAKKIINNSPKNPIKILAFVLLLTASWGLSGVNKAEANSVSWSSGTVPDLCYYWNFAGSSSYLGMDGWSGGLKSANVTISYKAQMINDVTGEAILDTSTIPVGTKISFDRPQTNTDISWFGTGGSSDSPYGRWVAKAAPPASADVPAFYVGRASFGFIAGYADIYVPLSVNRPAETITSLTPSSLSCSSDICTVIGEGNIEAKVIFPKTYGAFYYQYVCDASVSSSLCGNLRYFSKVAMRQGIPDSSVNMCSASWGGWLADSSYLLQVPEQSITFTLTGIIPNEPPTPPTITPLTTNNYFINTPQGFNIKATDPEGDTVQYCVDWGSDSVYANNCEVLSALQIQNTDWLMTKSFSTTGSKIFWVKAIDSKGSSSTWVSHTFTIVNQPENGVCSTVSPGVCLGGTYSATPTSTATEYKWSCTGLFEGTTATCSISKIPHACTGTLPSHTAVYTGDDTNLTVDTGYTYSPTDTAVQCQYGCASGYSRVGNSCVVNKCQGTLPVNASTYAGDEDNLANNTISYSYSATDTKPQCQYGCNNGFVRYNNACVKPYCLGTAPTAADHAVIYPNDTWEIPDMSFSYHYSSTPTTDKCEFTCANGYSRVGNACVQTITNVCLGTLPAHAVLYGSDESNPANDSTFYSHSLTDHASIKCEYGCTSGYSFNGGICVPPPNVCQGTLPSNTSLYGSDEESVSNSTTQYTYSPTDTSVKCEYGCGSGYVRYNDICRLPFCSTTGVPSFAHLWNASEATGLPTGTSPYTPVSNTLSNDVNHPAIKCEYQCNPGYIPNATNTGCVIDGLCGTADGKVYATNVSPEQFAPDTLCDAGVSPVPAVVAFPGKGQSVAWKCGSFSCVASRQQNASCGYKKGIPSFIPPTPVGTNALCFDGSQPAIINNTTLNRWEWTCEGWFGGADALCTAPKSSFKFWEF